MNLGPLLSFNQERVGVEVASLTGLFAPAMQSNAQARLV